jgi:hypothetical protein
MYYLKILLGTIMVFISNYILTWDILYTQQTHHQDSCFRTMNDEGMLILTALPLSTIERSTSLLIA